VALVRLPRRDDDVDTTERTTEAAWISAVIEHNGGVAPALLVEEVLELHTAYLRQARPPVPPDAGLGGWPTAAAPPGYAPPGYAPTGVGAPGSAPPGTYPGQPPPSVVPPPRGVPPVPGSPTQPKRR
jgi:hypothetical protein